MLVKPSQPYNAYSPIEVTLSGMTTVDSCLPIGRRMNISPFLLYKSPSILLKYSFPPSTSIEINSEHPLNVSGAIYVTVSGMVMRVTECSV